MVELSDETKKAIADVAGKYDVSEDLILRRAVMSYCAKVMNWQALGTHEHHYGNVVVLAKDE